MTFSKQVMMTTTVALGLMFMIGSGCSNSDDGKKVENAYLKREVEVAKAQAKLANDRAICYSQQPDDAARFRNCASFTGLTP